MTSRPWLVPAAVSAAVVLGFAAAAFALRHDPRRPALENLPADMVRSPASVTNQPASPTHGGFVQRPPPPHTVPYGDERPRFGASIEEAARAGRELSSPIPKSSTALARGEVVWVRACALCHGAAGRGDAPITKRGFPPPPALTRPESRALTDGEVFHAITYGRKNMPSAALQVDVADRWNVIQYVRKLQETR